MYNVKIDLRATKEHQKKLTEIAARLGIDKSAYIRKRITDDYQALGLDEKGEHAESVPTVAVTSE